MKIAWRIIEIIVKILAFILGLLGILAMILIAAFYFFDLNAHRHIIEQQYFAITGDNLKLKGPIAITLTPIPTFELNKVSLQVNSFAEPLYVTADEWRFKVNPMNLFSDSIHLYGIKGKNITLTYQQNNVPVVKTLQKFSGKLDMTAHVIDLTKLSVTLDNHLIEGEIHIKNLPTFSRVEARLSSPEWTVNADNTSAIFSLLGDDRVVGKLIWQCALLKYDDYRLQNTRLVLTKNKQEIELDAQGHMPGADVTSDTTVTNAKTQPKLDTDVTMDITDPQKALKQWIPHVQFSAAGLKITLKGKSQGKTAEELKKNFEGDLSGHAENITLKSGSQFAVHHLKFTLKWENERLHLASTGELPGGQYKGDFWITQWPDQPQIITDLHVDAQDAATFLQSVAPNLKIQGGTLNLHLQGKTTGKTFDDWKSLFKGHLFLHVQQMRVLEQSIDARLVDVFALFWHMFTPSAKETLFECVATRFWVNNGILLAEDNFAIETPDIYALGTGSIDFNRDWLGLSFDVYPRSKLPLQLGSYDNVVSIRGPMSKPNVTTSANGLIAKGGSIALGIATGGISSVVEKFIQIINQKGSPCAKVLAGEKQEAQPK